MTPELKAKWLNALRNGNYTQGFGSLHVDNTYCCLGVLCEIAGYEWEELAQDSLVFKCPARTDWIENEEELKNLGLPKKIHDICLNMNDGTSLPEEIGFPEKRSFSEIADWLESQEF